MLGTVGPSCDSWNGGITQDGPTQDGDSGGIPVRPCDASAGRSATFQFEFAGSVLRELGREDPAPSPRYDPREIPLMDRVRPRCADDFHVVHPKWHADLLRDDNDSWGAAQSWGDNIAQEEGGWHSWIWTGYNKRYRLSPSKRPEGY